MKYRKRIYYTEDQKVLMRDRWHKGDSINEIAQLFDRHHSSVQGIFARYGGMRPPVRRRSVRSLTLAEREEISRGIASRRSLRSIAQRLSRNERLAIEALDKVRQLVSKSRYDANAGQRSHNSGRGSISLAGIPSELRDSV